MSRTKRFVAPFVVAAALAATLESARAQQPITRADAVTAALARGARAALGRADTASARAALRAARLYPNPTLSATYTKDTPHYHLIGDVPLDLPWLRSARIGSAAAARDAGRYAFAFERAAITLDVDTTYTRALAAAARARLSRRTATDADSLLAMARLRHQVGDVSELDLRLAEVNAGQLENVAADDSLGALDALLAVQLAMGLPADQPTIALVDSLTPPPPVDTAPASTREPLPVAAATASLRSAERALTLAHRSVFPSPSLQIGVEQGDPTGSNSALPTIGLSVPLPLFNWNGGEVAQARAARDRAQATLDLVRRQTEGEIARARRELLQAMARVARDRRLLASADRVAAMALQGYAEGAFALPSVLEAQRNAREALGRYIDDVAAANDAAATVRLFAAGEEP